MIVISANDTRGHLKFTLCVNHFIASDEKQKHEDELNSCLGIEKEVIPEPVDEQQAEEVGEEQPQEIGEDPEVGEDPENKPEEDLADEILQDEEIAEPNLDASIAKSISGNGEAESMSKFLM